MPATRSSFTRSKAAWSGVRGGMNVSPGVPGAPVGSRAATGPHTHNARNPAAINGFNRRPPAAGVPSGSPGGTPASLGSAGADDRPTLLSVAYRAHPPNQAPGVYTPPN